MIKKTIKENFKFGDFVYTYYRFLDKFHSEPKSWNELLEFGNYTDVENKVHQLISAVMKKESKNG